MRNRKRASFRLGGLTAALTTTKHTSVARATSTSGNRLRYRLVDLLTAELNYLGSTIQQQISCAYRRGKDR